MSYVIYNNTGTILTVIPSGQVDNETTSLSLVGKDTYNFGTYYNQNLIKLLTNFSNNAVTPPNAPIQGQLWYDTTYKKIRVYDNEFSSVGASTISTTEPGGLSAGEFWYNPNTDALNFWTGFKYQTVSASPMNRASGWFQPPATIHDNSDPAPRPQTVTLLEQDGQVVGVLSNTAFVASTSNSQSTFSKANTSTFNVAQGLTVIGDIQATNGFVLPNSFTPPASASTGTQGQIAWDSNYVYVCIETNTWARAALSTSF